MKRHEDELTTGFHFRGVLPHLKREGASYFVTFRLAGTLPKQKFLELKLGRQKIIEQARACKRPLTWDEQEELFQWYSERVDKLLDAGLGPTWLREPAIADLVSGTINYHAGKRFDLLAWVVMPNHVHSVLRPLPSWTLTKILKSWKGYSAREANKLLNRTGMSFWQDESYDHLIRDADDQARCINYTIMNPVNANLCKRPEEWRWSSAYRP